MMNTTPLLLPAILATAVWFDVRQRRIPNLLIVIGLAVGLGSGALQGGWAELGRHALGAVAGLAILLPFFVLRVLGAGDAKLMAVVGGFTGVPPLLPIAFYTFVAGGLLALAALAATHRGRIALGNLRAALVAVVLRLQGTPVSLGDLGLQPAVRVPYAVAIASGVAIWLTTNIWLS